MPKSKTHNEIVLRPPPGTRFAIFGSDVRLEFQRGKEREIVQWLTNWIVNYIEPEALKYEAEQRAAIAAANVPIIDQLKTHSDQVAEVAKKQVKLNLNAIRELATREFERMQKLANESNTENENTENHGKSEE